MTKGKKIPVNEFMPDQAQGLQPRNWDKIVAESNGQRVFIPEELLTDVKKVEDMRKDFNVDINQVAKREIKLNVETNKVYLKMREYFENNGISDIWVKEIGLDPQALKDGKFILNVIDKPQR